MLALFGGGGRIRTIEAKRSRFTVCPLWPLGNSPRCSIVNVVRTELFYYNKKWENVKNFFEELWKICEERKWRTDSFTFLPVAKIKELPPSSWRQARLHRSLAFYFRILTSTQNKTADITRMRIEVTDSLFAEKPRPGKQSTGLFAWTGLSNPSPCKKS